MHCICLVDLPSLVLSYFIPFLIYLPTLHHHFISTKIFTFLQNEQKLYDDLAALFKREDIDVLNLVTTHNHYLRFKILHTGKVVYEEKYGVYDRMKGESYFDYIDFRKYYDLHDKLLSQRIAGMSI